MGGGSSRLEKRLGGAGFPEDERLFGLENFGNTCYCNSVLQALYFCVPFRNQVIAWHEKHQQGEETLLSCLGDLYATISKHRKRTGVVGPKKFVQVLKRVNEMYRGLQHQDAHEFLNYLLNEIIEKLKDEAKEKGGDPPDTTWVQEIFEGTITSEMRCLSCETITSRDEPFLDLSLEISENCSVTSCLKNFSSMETLHGRDKFHCNTCGSLQEAQKRIKVKALPSTLALHLKRFKYIESLQRFRKLGHRVCFPMELRLFNLTKEARDNDRKYELFAVVIHVGSGMNHGHYVSAIKIVDWWFLFDDDHVELIDEDEIQSYFGMSGNVASSESGYILFYQTVEQANQSRTTDEVPPVPIPG